MWLTIGIWSLVGVLHLNDAASTVTLYVRGDSGYDLSEPIPSNVKARWMVGKPDQVTGAVPQEQLPFYGYWKAFHWEVALASGLFIDHQTDFYLPDVVPINLTRTYRPQDDRSRSFGKGSTDSYELFLVGDNGPFTYVELIMPDGTRAYYRRVSPGVGYASAVYLHTASQGLFYGSTISWNGDGWDLRIADGTVLRFPASDRGSLPGQGGLVSITDPQGKVLRIKRDRWGNKLRITSPGGGTLLFKHDRFNRITEARDNEGHIATYSYDSTGHLGIVKDIAGGVTRYSYNAAGEMLTITDPKGQVWMKNTYDDRHRVIAQDVLTGHKSRRYVYSTDKEGHTTATDVIFANGLHEHHVFDSRGYEILPKSQETEGAVSL